MFGKKDRKLIISDSDIEAALAHLNSLPQTITKSMPNPWAKQQFIDWLKKSIPQKIEYAISFDVATGIYGHIVPVSYGYRSMPDDGRYLVILSIRSVKTDFDRLNELN